MAFHIFKVYSHPINHPERKGLGDIMAGTKVEALTKARSQHPKLDEIVVQGDNLTPPRYRKGGRVLRGWSATNKKWEYKDAGQSAILISGGN